MFNTESVVKMAIEPIDPSELPKMLDGLRKVDKQLLGSVCESLVQGYQWATCEGPLCKERIRNVKFKMLHVVIVKESLYGGGGQFIATARRCAYSAFMATPGVVEPSFVVEVFASADCVSSAYTVRSSCDGLIWFRNCLANAYTRTGILHVGVQPLADRAWRSVRQVNRHPHSKVLILFTVHFLRAVKFVPVRRNGLSEDVSVNKFFYDPMLLELAEQEDVFSYSGF
ncbi:unnamed protein product [Cylicocyclus nassatus]|uniref:Translation elongation factor EFG/EF2 domain-containing protein n=1 Tax=Cylicocyclus nassatus TaxID=53992 RepID=A0AA36MHT8_CYLNA|nr:unnamed protein product [Cylicocyclus nassatus]